jgi:hypothetical protein
MRSRNPNGHRQCQERNIQMTKFIRDEKGRVIGQIADVGGVAFVRDGQGRLKGQYIKSADKTLDERGRYFGPGDQLLRLLD